MPPADASFLEDATAKSWGKTPDEWRCLTVDCRARMMVHDIIAGKREGFYGEAIEKVSKTKGKGGGEPEQPNPLFDLMQRRVTKR